MKKRQIIDVIPDTQFRLLVSLFLARNDAISFQQKVLSAHGDSTMALKSLGAQKAGRIALKHLQSLSAIAEKQVAEAMTANKTLMTVLERHVD